MNAVLTFLHRVKFILELEKERVMTRGLVNNLIGWGTLFCIFAFIPPLVKSIWPANIENPFMFYLIAATLVISLTTPCYLLLYLPGKLAAYLGYMKWVPAYEKYRITPEISKPWERSDWP